MKIEKGTITHVPAEYQAEEGCVAFQMVRITYSFFGAVRSDDFDTKILECGKQFIHGGNGFIKNGFEIN